MSDMINDLLAQHIKLKHHSTGAHKTTCPRCSHARKDKNDPCLWVNIEGDKALWKCYNCFWTGAAGNVLSGQRDEPRQRDYKKPEPIEPVSSGHTLPPHVVEFLNARGLTLEVAIRNRIFWDEKRGAIAFPYYVNNELVNIKYRTPDKKFSMTTGAKLTFYGIDDVRHAWKTTDEMDVIIVEGEFDKLALEVCGLTHVLSVPNGAPARVKRDGEIEDTPAFAYLQGTEELFKQARRVILATDDDAAGDNLRFELSRRIGAAKCFVVKFPEKDANGCLQKLGADLVLDCIRDATPYPIAGLYSVAEVSQELENYYNVGMVSGVPTGFENLDKYYTVMKGEVDVITGVPNSGKSEFLDALTINLAKNENWKIGIFSPEGNKEAHIALLIEKIIGLPSSPGAENRMSLDQFMSGAAWINKHFFFIRADDEDALPTLDYVIEKASAAVFRYGIDGLIIDPWNELEHTIPNGTSETNYVGKALARICRWSKNRNVKTWIVAHPQKITADKDGKIRVPGLYDIFGSSNWANKVDNGLVVHRSGDVASTTEVFIKKVRSKFVGKQGVISLRYEKETGRYTVPPNYEKYEKVHSDDPDMKSWDV